MPTTDPRDLPPLEDLNIVLGVDPANNLTWLDVHALCLTLAEEVEGSVNGSIRVGQYDLKVTQVRPMKAA